MTRIRLFALLAIVAVAACSEGEPTAAAPGGASYDETETCRSGWPVTSGRCPDDPDGEPGEP